MLTKGSASYTWTQTYWYRYDSGANLVSVTIGGEICFYVRNAQNDVIALIDGEGNTVVEYTYDSWGKVLGITGSLADTVGVQNPFRYRGYYYDSETGMYYLKSRYYDPGIRRFLCADTQVNDSILGTNLYAYCENEPIGMLDLDGYSAIATGILMIGMLSVVGGYFISQQPSVRKNISNLVQTTISSIGRIKASRGYAWEAEKNKREVLLKIENVLPKLKQNNYKSTRENHHIVARRAGLASGSKAILEAVGIDIEIASAYKLPTIAHSPELSVKNKLKNIKMTLQGWDRFFAN